jgi:spore coat polysaccharide biosynthesis predicted glycosyltransferase SpsG
MGTILFAWELGSGFGHLMRIAAMANPLCAKGHRVFLAARELENAYRVFKDTNVALLPAPSRSRPTPPIFPHPQSFTQLLCNIGFANETIFKSHAQGWRNLFHLTKPDLIVFDHSPTALVAARGISARRMVIGTGFCIPPDLYPLPNMRIWQRVDANSLKEVEDKVLRRVNEVLHGFGQPPLERVGQLYSQVDESVLTTFRELDHYPNRAAAKYWGPINSGDVGGEQPNWPQGAGKKIYAYLKKLNALPAIFQQLKATGLPTLVYADGIDPQMQKEFECATLRFATGRLDIKRTAAECDVAITHGTLNTTAMMLMAGKPVLMLPLLLEQGITAHLVKAQGAGLDASLKNPDSVRERLDVLLNNDRYAKAASRLAASFSSCDLGKNQLELGRRVEELLARNSEKSALEFV